MKIKKYSNIMTNKLPEIGKRYISKRSGNILTVKQVKNDITIITDGGDLWDEDYFCTEFEELPDHEPTTEETSEVEWDCPNEQAALNWNTEDHFVNDNKKVQEALKEVKRELKEWEDDCLLSSNKYSQKPLDREGVISTFNHVQNLINALEENPLACSNLQEAPVSSIVEHASKSIWKPISELPEYENKHVIGKTKGGDCLFGFPYQLNDGYVTLMNIDNIGGSGRDYFESFCLLKDFINHQESLEERIERLEQLTKDK